MSILSTGNPVFITAAPANWYRHYHIITSTELAALPYDDKCNHGRSHGRAADHVECVVCEWWRNEAEERTGARPLPANEWDLFAAASHREAMSLGCEECGDLNIARIGSQFNDDGSVNHFHYECGACQHQFNVYVYDTPNKNPGCECQGDLPSLPTTH